ncbi:MAG: HlyD family efflux transporter periplasmic adaptor subunit [Anaerolineae bacterium]|jgi:multidrug efflux pump subunit AcrA (membrane-fusion protein)|nr:HlyD family efflux transporter periplasmic adaptor subunit [Anaerolineae bacterium]MBT4309878.1 HlyD family efflux transporter periplasmic adaptor subunit [Anaerolineae bacterium]MBT4843628.1 HlyD family efflux transporter periplasmic adaptor subunit [Anaerolineae bacterium]MBT6321836.1 HlyD family efflux transporter periplasmic adaptor subunit [Anaerolineae bacterium]MBT7016971.1 HlyD family efflux transporter periplasmic adaptor subunit [Anaerolineae bacterium]
MFIKFFSRKKTLWVTGLIVTLLAVGGFYASQKVTADSESANEPTMQTAKIRQGDLTLYASGTGTLIPAAEASFGFRASGQLLSLSVVVGDAVEAGDFLAELDNTAEKIKFQQAERALAELTSPASIASAEQALALAEREVSDSQKSLAYQISWAVLRSEEKVAEAEEALLLAKESSNEEKTAEAELALENAERVLAGNWDYYENHYIPENFKVAATRSTPSYIAIPTEFDILEARAGYAIAQAELVEATDYLAVINGNEIPEGATGSNLKALEQAQLDLISAQDGLNATRLYAPISGTVMSFDAQVGDTVGTSTIVTIADTSESYLEIFLDETDWGMINVGYPVEVIFDVLSEKTFEGEVVQVDPALYTEQNSSLVRGLVRLDDAEFSGSKLPVGSAAAVEVIGGRAEEAILVPVEALREASPGQYTVFVMIDDEPKLRVVEVGLQDLFYAEILSGLEPGDVVTTGIAETE